MLYTEERLISVVLKRRGGRVKVRGCLVLMVEDTCSFGKAVIMELLVCLLLDVMNRRDDLRKRDPTSPELPRMNKDIQNRICVHKRQKWRLC